ncbi:hypothetical protein FRC03_012293 [Tulasnella sp. 419]|nr:hypothetical protein FRC03_012293 [Tulasnella sp. 419]
MLSRAATVLLLFTSLSSLLVQAQKAGVGQSCIPGNSRLADGTYQFTGDCDPTTYCAQDGICRKKGCRRNEYPFGYRLYTEKLPPRCPVGQFCPDEEDACMPLQELGSLCQLNRDDQCAPPPNWQELASPRNFNGSVCLNYHCMYANVTLGNDCLVDNMPYIAYEAGTGREFINVVSRGNCVTGLYCDSVQLKCMKTKVMGEACTGDKECETDNCTAQGVCGELPDAAHHLPVYVYILVALCIAAIMFGTTSGLFILHRRHRAEEREKREQYWRDQETYRQNILQMREHARSSLLSLPWQQQRGDSKGEYAASESSHTGMMHAASQPSGLRNGFSDSMYDDDKEGSSMEEALVMKGAPTGIGGRRSARKS